MSGITAMPSWIIGILVERPNASLPEKRFSEVTIEVADNPTLQESWDLANDNPSGFGSGLFLFGVDRHGDH
jgi:hypothetical protein